MRDRRAVLWQGMTDRQIEAARQEGAIVAVPVGAIEQHGAHLPVDTDTHNAFAITVSAAQRTPSARVLVTPALPFGLSPHHRSFSSTISLRLATFLAVVRDIGANLVDSGFTKVVLVNGHGGNSAPLRSLTTELVAEGLPVAAVDYWKPSEAEWSAILAGSLKTLGHACEFETALQMALVDAAQADEILAAVKNLCPRVEQPWIARGEPDPIVPAGASWSPIFHGDDCGYYGDPASANLEIGTRLIEVVSDGLAGFFESFAAADLKVGVVRRT
jgi:creatinine amidohydrolase